MPTDQSSSAAIADRLSDGTLRILVAWDPGNDESGGTEALEFAAWLGRSTPVSVRVASTLLRPWPASLNMMGKKYKKWRKHEAEACAEAVEKALKSVDLPRSQWDKQFSTFSDGQNEAQLLTDEAQRFDADLILVGSNAAASKGRFLAGSTADALMHSSPTALGLAPRAVKLSKKGITRVNFAYIDKRADENSSGLLFAAELAATLEVTLRIITFSPTGLTDAALNKPKGIGSELIDEWNEQSLAMLDLARDRVIEHRDFLEVETEVGSGKGWGNAVDSLKWKKGDILCMDSHPMGTLERVFVGSTANEFLRHVPVPVVIHPYMST
ncbi:universal stress protein [Corynebacterium cystitidis]|uniref:Nucleotide-binding universal stress protein, UspA family n=1 Tax=Corynebacterium cystitidis DSM 20524 TaxID=1121357 RepID=A0A1H9UY95_9CORY|nr:universal stress protein [Corynebacterium cystitidis]WJY83638.1 Universal stress protein family protein [Corynebacterium cystitidis DSM 20524]SES14455.1 Nucleotide-binding universal stress protein, UspA family [Corynebacterium cystitidis DSM 20524]SNV91598.1 universal stress protein [Corynebacterium cystitidis]